MSQTRVVANPISVGVALLQAMRPHQWTKNLLVFAALLFTAQFTHLTLLWQTVLGFFALCFTASSIYLVNDILDRERDRRHPKNSIARLRRGGCPCLWRGWARRQRWLSDWDWRSGCASRLALSCWCTPSKARCILFI